MSTPASLAVACPACMAAPGIRCLAGRRNAHRIRCALARQAAGTFLSGRLRRTLARWNLGEPAAALTGSR